MGKTLGILSLVFGLVSFALSPLSYFDKIFILRILLSIITPGLAVAGIICGAIWISKDDRPGLAIAGLVISNIALLNFVAGFTLNFMGITY